jgi:replicative DNA helicase Mcm
MGLRTKVTREDAKAAIRLMNESLRMVALNQDGKIDIDKLVSPMDSSQRNDSDKIRRAMDDFESRGISVVSAEELLTMVESMGVPRDRAESVLRKMILEGILFEPSTGKVKRVQS